MANGDEEAKMVADTATDMTAINTGQPIFSVANHKTFYAQAYKELCKAVTGEEPSDILPPENYFKEKVIAYINANREYLHQKICIEFGYCDKRNKLMNISGFLDATGILIGIFSEISTFGTASAMWLWSSFVFEGLCKCSK